MQSQSAGNETNLERQKQHEKGNEITQERSRGVTTMCTFTRGNSQTDAKIKSRANRVKSELKWLCARRADLGLKRTCFGSQGLLPRAAVCATLYVYIQATPCASRRLSFGLGSRLSPNTRGMSECRCREVLREMRSNALRVREWNHQSRCLLGWKVT